jgi:hypothetical protein
VNIKQQIATAACRGRTRRWGLAAGMAATTAALAVSGPAWASAQASGPEAAAGPGATETFGYVGPRSQTAVVPEGAGSAELRVTGAMGGKTCNDAGTSCPAAGGDGARVSGTVVVRPGQVLLVAVGGYGGNSQGNRNPGAGGWGATGNGGRGGGAHGYFASADGGGGGGASGVAIADCTGCAATTLAIAGGGGGAGGRGFDSGTDAGGPGGSSGATVDSGHDGKGPGAGRGGSGSNSAPVGGGGGNGSASGGGGGGGAAGYVGGRGGGGGSTGGGGGGGGGAGSPHYAAALLAPAVVRGPTSGAGVVQITWITSAIVPICFDQAVSVPVNSPGVRVQLLCAPGSRVTSYRIITHPNHGFLDSRDFTTGTFTYVPLPGYSGPDTLVYQGMHGNAPSAPTTVTFTVGLSADRHATPP